MEKETQKYLKNTKSFSPKRIPFLIRSVSLSLSLSLSLFFFFYLHLFRSPTSPSPISLYFLLPLFVISLNLLLLSVLQEMFCTYKCLDELGFNFMERDYQVIFLQIFFLYGLIIKKCMYQYLDELRKYLWLS